LHRLNETVERVTAGLNRYDFGDAGQSLYHFIWDELCHWYIEFAKLPLYGDDEAAKDSTRSVLAYVLDQSLRLLHPFMPFITEEIRQHLPVEGDSITVASWPQSQSRFEAPEAVGEMEILIETIRAVRNTRAEMDLMPKQQVDLLIRAGEEAVPAFRNNEAAIRRLCGVDRLEVDPSLRRPERAMALVVTGAEIFLPLEGVIDIEQTIAKLEGERKKLDKEVERVEKKLAN